MNRASELVNENIIFNDLRNFVNKYVITDEQKLVLIKIENIINKNNLELIEIKKAYEKKY